MNKNRTTHILVIALCAASNLYGLTEQEKLNYIKNCNRWKIQMKDMIDNGFDPNRLVMRSGDSVLNRSVRMEDVEFTTYLLEHGAIPDEQTLAMVKEKPELAKLMLAQKLVGKILLKRKKAAEAKEKK
jgi:hypothetical protein